MAKYSILAMAASAVIMLSACGGAQDAATSDKPPEPSATPETEGENHTENQSPAASTETPEAAAPSVTADQPTTETPPAAVDASVEPTGPGKVIVVMDGSGSMWGQIDGKSKMEIARGAFRDLVHGLPSDAETGLMAYGHRQAGDCDDIELLQPPEAGASERLVAAVDAITPTGKTPLSAAVQQAADTLGYGENKATVILVTDGIETCDVDPCVLGETLEEQGIDFTAHIVGFGLSEQEGRQVACLAEETGGRYIEASDAGELSSAMELVAEAVEAEPEPVDLTDEAALTVPDSVQIGQSFDVSWTGPNAPHEHDYVDLVEADYEKTSRSLSFSYTEDGAPQLLRAPAEPGTYNVRYVWLGAGKRTVIAEEPVEVVDAEAAVFAPETVSIGTDFDVQWRGPDNRNDYIDLVPPEQTATNTQVDFAYTKNGETLSMTAPGSPGDYKVRYITQGSGGERVLASVPITIEDARAEVAFNPSVELGSILEVSWTGPDTRNDYIDIVERGFDRTNSQLAYAYTKSGNPAELRLPGDPGEYDVRYILSATSDGERVLARAPLSLTETEVSLDFPAELEVGDVLEVNWVGPNARSDYIDIVERGFDRTNTQLSYAYTKNGNPAELRLPGDPGEYDVRYIMSASDGERVMETQPLTIAATDVTLTHPDTIALGKVLEVEWAGPEHNLNYVDIVERGFRKTNTQLSYAYARDDILELKLPAKPGDYDVRFILSAADGETVLARNPLTITNVEAGLTGPDSAAAGAVLEINWEGPGAYGDFIDVVPRGKQLPKDSITQAYTRRSNPVELTMPDEPGDYDMRYIHVGSDERVVKVRREILVE